MHFTLILTTNCLIHSKDLYLYLFPSLLYTPKKTLTSSSTLLTSPHPNTSKTSLGAHVSASYAVTIQRLYPRARIQYNVLGAHTSAFDYWGPIKNIMTPVQRTSIYLVQKKEKREFLLLPPKSFRFVRTTTLWIGIIVDWSSYYYREYSK
jgi:hypothetical protein